MPEKKFHLRKIKWQTDILTFICLSSLNSNSNSEKPLVSFFVCLFDELTLPAFIFLFLQSQDECSLWLRLQGKVHVQPDNSVSRSAHKAPTSCLSRMSAIKMINLWCVHVKDHQEDNNSPVILWSYFAGDIFSIINSHITGFLYIYV